MKSVTSNAPNQITGPNAGGPRRLPMQTRSEAPDEHFPPTMKRQIHFFFLTGWLIPAGIALVFFGRWITEIVIPTLKGGSFDQLYDLHGVRYLDTTMVCAAIAFGWVAIMVLRWARKLSNVT